ncbi:hypothetical protein PIROE2DRAFT_61219 [Piromyces sp. E2]|nr:hypothetical protein PIROE2DRAFT_61219 [Piromyces sp. E2]|eukprot:OUM63537.1 hypothetical protein PIROE2DRAFT_61219 [Piromyces sp. E2]
MYSEPEPMQYYTMDNNYNSFPSSPPSAPPSVPFNASAPSAPPSIPCAPSAPSASSAPSAPPTLYEDEEYEEEKEDSLNNEEEEEEKNIIQQTQKNNIQINNAVYSVNKKIVEPSTPKVIKDENNKTVKENEPTRNIVTEKQPIINPVKIGVRSHIKANTTNTPLTNNTVTKEVNINRLPKRNIPVDNHNENSNINSNVINNNMNNIDMNMNLNNNMNGKHNEFVKVKKRSFSENANMLSTVHNNINNYNDNNSNISTENNNLLNFLKAKNRVRNKSVKEESNKINDNNNNNNMNVNNNININTNNNLGVAYRGPKSMTKNNNLNHKVNVKDNTKQNQNTMNNYNDNATTIGITTLLNIMDFQSGRMKGLENKRPQSSRKAKSIKPEDKNQIKNKITTNSKIVKKAVGNYK